MRRSLPRLVALLLGVLQPIAMAHAEMPAVSELNGKISAAAGAEGQSGRSKALGAVHGAITAPLGHSFGIQLDGAGLTTGDVSTGFGMLHMFWRDPAIGLFGPIAARAVGPTGQIGWYGAEGQLYLNAFTVSGSAGYFDAASAGTSVASGAFGAARLTAYPLPDLALSLGAEVTVGRALGLAAIEYQPSFGERRNLALFAHATSDGTFYGVLAGVRFYFGPSKPLIRRHREDDPVVTISHEYDGIVDFPMYPLNPLQQFNALVPGQ